MTANLQGREVGPSNAQECAYASSRHTERRRDSRHDLQHTISIVPIYGEVESDEGGRERERRKRTSSRPTRRLSWAMGIRMRCLVTTSGT